MGALAKPMYSSLPAAEVSPKAVEAIARQLRTARNAYRANLATLRTMDALLEEAYF